MGYAKVWKTKKMWTHEGPRRKRKKRYMDTWKSNYIYEKMMSMWRLMQNDSHVSQYKFIREITHIEEYSIGLKLFYPHTCTSWSKGMTSFSLDPSLDLTKYVE